MYQRLPLPLRVAPQRPHLDTMLPYLFPKNLQIDIQPACPRPALARHRRIRPLLRLKLLTQKLGPNTAPPTDLTHHACDLLHRRHFETHHRYDLAIQLARGEPCSSNHSASCSGKVVVQGVVTKQE